MVFQYDYVAPVIEDGDNPPIDPMPGRSIEIEGEEGSATVMGNILFVHEVDQAAGPRRSTLSIQVSAHEPGLPELKVWLENDGDVGIRVLPG